MDNKIEENIAKWEKIYGKDPSNITRGERFKYVLAKAEEKTGHKAVVLIDEYDKPLLDPLGEEQELINREVLRGFYGTFKSADPHLRFVLLTGVTKFAQITVFSGFNQANDLTMDSKYDAICGITEEELYTVFAEPIKQMADKFKITPDEMKLKLKKRYDGYHFSGDLLDIYNPFSLLNAFKKMKLQDYWYQSGTPTYLAKLIEGHHINMQKLIAKPYTVDYFLNYRADAEDPLAMFYQSGYLTIKDYDEEYEIYFLYFPNTEL